MPSLLALPTEIRERILHSLLYNPKPLSNGSDPKQRERNFSLHPAILRTCHQLCDEGTSVLYGSNTVTLNVWGRYALQESYVVGCLGYEILQTFSGDSPTHILSLIPQNLRRRTRKWYIQITLLRHHKTQSLTILLRQLCQELQQAREIFSLDVSLELLDHGGRKFDGDLLVDFKFSSLTTGTRVLIDEDPKCTKAIAIASQSFHPFTLLRVKHSVAFNYVDRDLTMSLGPALERLARLMRSSYPVIDLPRMYGSFIWVAETAKTSYRDDAEWMLKKPYEASTEAYDNYNVDEFRKARRRFFLKHFHVRLWPGRTPFDRVLTHDPPWKKLDREFYCLEGLGSRG